MALRGTAQRAARLRSRCPSAACGVARPRTPRACSPTGMVARRPRPAAVDESRCKQWRDRVMFLRRPRARPGPIFPTRACSAAPTNGWCRRSTTRPRSRQFRRRSCPRAMALLPWDLRAPARSRGADTFRGATGSRCAIDYEAEEGPTLRVRVQELFGLDRHPAIAAAGAAGARTAVAGAAPGPGDARSARASGAAPTPR